MTVDPLQARTVPCPQCHAQPGEPCRHPSDSESGVSHGRRWDALDAQQTAPASPAAVSR